MERRRSYHQNTHLLNFQKGMRLSIRADRIIKADMKNIGRPRSLENSGISNINSPALAVVGRPWKFFKRLLSRKLLNLIRRAADAQT